MLYTAVVLFSLLLCDTNINVYNNSLVWDPKYSMFWFLFPNLSLQIYMLSYWLCSNCLNHQNLRPELSYCFGSMLFVWFDLPPSAMCQILIIELRTFISYLNPLGILYWKGENDGKFSFWGRFMPCPVQKCCACFLMWSVPIRTQRHSSRHQYFALAYTFETCLLYVCDDFSLILTYNNISFRILCGEKSVKIYESTSLWPFLVVCRGLDLVIFVSAYSAFVLLVR